MRCSSQPELSPARGPADSRYAFADLAIDASGNRSIVIEQYANALIAVDLTTGARSVVSPTPGSNPVTKLARRSSIGLDSANNRAFVTIPDYRAVVAVDLATGTRSIVSGGGVGTGAALSQPSGVVYDDVSSPGTPRLLVSEGGGQGGGAGQITAIDLSTGDRTVLNSNAGGGPSFDNTSRMAFDVSGRRLFTDAAAAGILAIDLASGQRIKLVDSRVGRGVAMNFPMSVAVEQASGTAASLLFADSGLATIMRLDLATGVRTAVADSQKGIGSGPSVFGITEIVTDTRPSSNGHTAFALRNVAVPPGLRGRDFYTVKDRKMADEADYGFMIWDAESPGTLNNIIELVNRHKKVLVYIFPEQLFSTIASESEVKNLLRRCDKETAKVLAARILHSNSDESAGSVSQAALSF